ncbi:MAG: hypothetical protein K2K55_10665 [Duncaniella sp.]|nr:hypothetical protein [Duncaniella sp.]
MKRYLYAWLVIGLALLMGACTSKNGERLQNAVPADVTSVVFLDKSFVNELAEVSDDDTFFSKGGINGVGLFTLGTLTDEVIVMDVESVGAVRDYFLAKNYKVVNAASELYSDPEGKKFIIISSQNKCVYLGSPRNDS